MPWVNHYYIESAFRALQGDWWKTSTPFWTKCGTKSPREIAILREATRIAGLGIIEAMRDARPGMMEYELQADAEYGFKKYGAYGPAYFALIATGENTWYSHYHKNRHNVGMEVHDVRNPTATLEPGQVFTIVPAMRIAEEHVWIRLEDKIPITETGYENLSVFVPVEIADIQKT